MPLLASPATPKNGVIAVKERAKYDRTAADDGS